MSETALFPTAYPADFEAARAAYSPAKNDSKADALKAWEQTKKRRMSMGAFGQRMTYCIEAYNLWLDEENAKRRRQRQSDHPKLHFATFLRQFRCEGFMPDAEARLASEHAAAITVSGAFPGWESEAAGLIAELGRPVFDAWFKGVRVDPGPPATLEFPKMFAARWVDQHFRAALKRAFGTCIITVTGQPSERFVI